MENYFVTCNCFMNRIVNWSNQSKGVYQTGILESKESWFNSYLTSVLEYKYYSLKPSLTDVTA